MSIVNIHEAKTHLSRILERVEKGDQVVIARNGQPSAKRVPIGEEPRRPGRLRGRIRVAKDFDDPLPEPLAHRFRGRER